MYETMVNMADMAVELQESGLTENSVREYKNLLSDDLTPEEVSLSKLRLINSVIDAKKDVVVNSVNAIYSVYNDFDVAKYIQFCAIVRKNMAGQPLNQTELMFLDGDFDNIFLALSAKATILRHYLLMDRNNIGMLKKYSVSVKDLSAKAEEKRKTLKKEGGYYVNSY